MSWSWTCDSGGVVIVFNRLTSANTNKRFGSRTFSFIFINLGRLFSSGSFSIRSSFFPGAFLFTVHSLLFRSSFFLGMFDLGRLFFSGFICILFSIISVYWY